MALTKVSTGVVDMSGNTGGLVIAKGTDAQKPTCTAANLGSIRENTDENKVEVCTSTGWQFLEEAGPSFIPLTVDYLVVAGGGAGGRDGGRGGGGGAGGATIGTLYGGDTASGGSGVVILRYPSSRSAALSGGAIGSVDQPITGSTDKYAEITGSGTITFS